LTTAILDAVICMLSKKDVTVS